MYSFTVKITVVCCILRCGTTASMRWSGISAKRMSRVKFYYNDLYEVKLPITHRFPMQKYRLVREMLQEQYKHRDDVIFEASPLVTREELISTHCPIYVDNYLNGNLTAAEIRKTGFPWDRSNVDRSLSSVGGTLAAMRTVMMHDRISIAGHIAGGTHHAFYNYGEGFCIFSDIAVACNRALIEYPEIVRQVLIIDLDVHQGNGNAKLFQDDPQVFTFSMHCKDNYFSEKQQSNIDVELEAGLSDDGYLSKLKVWLPYLMDIVKPQLVFFQAGVDIYEGDRLGKLGVTREGLMRRNSYVYQYVLRRNIKCVVTMGGGYPKDLDPASPSFQSILQCHADVYRSCIDHVTRHAAE